MYNNTDRTLIPDYITVHFYSFIEHATWQQISRNAVQ